jgi:GPH family glycoside/pentoside/hexuronide:cation symporter
MEIWYKNRVLSIWLHDVCAKAIAALILGYALTKIGFEPNQVQTEETLTALKFLMSWIPLAGICLSFVLVYFYPIDKAFHEKLLQDIQEKRLLNE